MRAGLALLPLVVFVGCNTAPIDPKAMEFGLAGLPCTGDGCVDEPTACSGTPAASADQCRQWRAAGQRRLPVHADSVSRVTTGIGGAG